MWSIEGPFTALTARCTRLARCYFTLGYRNGETASSTLTNIKLTSLPHVSFTAIRVLNSFAVPSQTKLNLTWVAITLTLAIGL